MSSCLAGSECLWKALYRGGKKNSNRETQQGLFFSTHRYIANLFGQTYMYTFHQRGQSEGSERGVRVWVQPEAAAPGRAGGQCQGQFERAEANTQDLAHRVVQQNMKRRVREDRQGMRKTALFCTFSLQLSSTSVLIRLSHPSVNQAGSLQHKQTHGEE